MRRKENDRSIYLLKEWAEDVADNCHKSGFYGINIVEKLLRDPGISMGKARYRALWWPRNKRIAMVERFMHRVDPVTRVCLIIKHGRVQKKQVFEDSDDGSLFTKQDLASHSSVGARRFDKITRDAETKFREFSRT